MQNKVILGWVVKARLKDPNQRHLIKIISPRRYYSISAAETFVELAKKTGEYEEVWYSEDDGYAK